jgi:hypothetical protein
MKTELKTDAATNRLPSDRHIIRCYFVPPLMRPATTISLTADRELVFEAMRLLIRLDGMLREARADWNQDRFRRLMRLRTKAAARLRRRWAKLDRPLAVILGALRRRYHSNLACYIYGGP